MENPFPTYKFLNSEVEYQIITEENQFVLSEYMLLNNKKKLIITSDAEAGWNSDVLPDLRNFYFLEVLLVYWTNIKNIEGIHFCKKLKVLWLDNDDKTEVYFEKFPALEKVITWNRKGVERIWNVSTIKELTIAGINQKHLKETENVNKIEKLRVLKSSIDDISFISNFSKITFLELLEMSKLQDLRPIENLQQLKHLRIRANKVIKFSFLTNLKKIETLYLSSKVGEFKIEEFKHLTKIKNFNISGNNRIQQFNRELHKYFDNLN